jgi:hypothetical protein
MPTLDEIWNSSGGTAPLGKPDASMDEIWQNSAKPGGGSNQQRGVWDQLTGQTGPRYQLWPERFVRGIAGAAMEGPKLMGDVAEGRVDPTSREGVGSAVDVAATFSPLAPMRAGVMIAAKAARGGAPAREALFDDAEHAYEELRDANVPLAKHVVEDLSSKAKEMLNKRAFYKEDQQATWRALNRLKNPVGEHSTSNEVYAARTSLNNVIRDNPGKSEATAAKLAMQHLDDYLSNVPGFAETAQRARGNYRAGMQSERVGKATERGELNAATSRTGGVLDQKLKDRFKALYLDEKVPKTPEQAALMKEIVYGGNINKIANLFAKLGPTHLSGWGTAAAADLHGGSGLATLSLALGAFAQRISERATTGKIQQLDELIRRDSPLGGGGRTPPQTVVHPPTASGALGPAAGSALAQPDDALSPSPSSGLDFSFIGTANAAEDKPRSKFEPEQTMADKITPRPLAARGAPQSAKPAARTPEERAIEFAKQMEARRRATHPADERDEESLVSKGAATGGQAAAREVDAQSLKASRFDRTSFDSQLENLSNRPRQELENIAPEFLGYKGRFNSKDDIIAQIRKRQRQEELSFDRDRAQDKLKP